MSAKRTPVPWVYFDPSTATYNTQDGTRIPCEVADSAECLADVLRIATIREQQRAATERSP